ncbi:DUF3422 domain-containing protein [Bradyrhizobium genosp. SA-3]|uniref:DUF3422 domain-containing protein n=1 Tax=Bradyrhizobium genosp. SA-3 TaxID=508868 RepID=UPI00102996D1|nr:DUF3422 domain-containing protein [Bradyrhizobium genosp. SA-3]RZN09931.1 DUF3422 domain-containing protein [Bradyrhizobium genosp. SA-3]
MLDKLDLSKFTVHPQRDAVLAEVHARPFTQLVAPFSMIHFAFLAKGEAAASDRHRFVAFCREHDVPAPDLSAKHHQIAIEPVVLRWEQHSEFATFTWIWSTGNGPAARHFDDAHGTVQSLMRALRQDGQLLVAIKLDVEGHTSPARRAGQLFDKSSLAMARVKGGASVMASDFRVDENGFTKILVCDLGMTPHNLGALVQRLLEIETYRPLALLGLSAALELGPFVDRIDRRLIEVLEGMQGAEGLKLNSHLLAELTALAASFERGATGSPFRFGASRAYNDLVQSRLSIIEGSEIAGYPTWSSFLARRMAPAMRTCETVENRQVALSAKLARAADLLRTRVDVEIERQNRDLLHAINERTGQQLRLQRTVEGLSVAAIGYYVVSLFGYLAKGAHDVGLQVEPSYLTAACVPIAVCAVWLLNYNIRKRHLDRSDEPSVTRE